MTTRPWPSVEYPLVEWSDRELIDQYRHIRPRLDEGDPTVDDDTSVTALIQEIIRRGLDDMAEDA